MAHGKDEMAMNGVWINGFEQISCLGIGARAFADKRERGIEFWQGMYPWAGVPDHFKYEEMMGGVEAPETRQMDMLAKYAVACSSLMMKECLPSEVVIRGERMGIIVGSAFGCTGANHSYLENLVALGPRRVSPVGFRNTVSNAAAGHLAITFRLLGSNSMFNSGMVSGAQALAYAYEEIVSGRCDAILSGAVDWTSSLIQKRFRMQAERYGQPVVPLMDGACMFVLGREQRSVFGDWQLSGYGMGFLDAQDPHDSFLRIVRKTIKTASIDTESVDAFQLQSDTGSLWVRSTKEESLETVCAGHAVRMVNFPENTALPITLSLAASLQFLSGAQVPTLFLRDRNVQHIDRTPRCFIFAAVGADGNTVLLLFKRSGDTAGKDV